MDSGCDGCITVIAESTNKGQIYQYFIMLKQGLTPTEGFSHKGP